MFLYIVRRRKASTVCKDTSTLDFAGGYVLLDNGREHMWKCTYLQDFSDLKLNMCLEKEAYRKRERWHFFC